MNTKTLLVDGSYLLKRSFHGAKDGYTRVGYIGGVYGFLTKIRKFIKEEKYNKIVIMWDGENGGLARHKIYKPYKSNRKDKSWYDPIELTEAEIRAEHDKDKSILLQRKKVQQYSEELFFRQIEANETEADDLIAAYCIKHHKDEEITLYTNDKDFLQLLYLDIYIYLESLGAKVESGNFFLYFKYFWRNALTMKIMCGDTSDKIAGIPGLKETTLLKYFPELIDSTVTVRDICKKSVEINEERKKLKKKPIEALAKITTPEGIAQLKINFQLMNLSEPILNEEAKQELEQLDMPLSDENRGGNHLYELMTKDDFLALYSNYGDYASYVQPFYLIISREKDLLKNFNKIRLNS